MLYTFDNGARGLTLPRHYSVTKGAKLTLAPRELIATVPLPTVPQVALRDLAKYGAAPVTALAVTVLFMQLAGSPSKPAMPQPTHSTPDQNSTAAWLTSVNTKTGQSSNAQTGAHQTNAPLSGSTPTASSNQAPLVDPVMTSPVVSTGSTDPITGGIGGGDTTTPIVPPVDTSPVGGSDPGTGTTTDPTDPGTNNPGTGTTDPGTGGTITTPVVQVGVDVFPPSVTLGLTP